MDKSLEDFIDTEFRAMDPPPVPEMLEALDEGRIDKLGILRVRAGLAHDEKGLLVCHCPSCGLRGRPKVFEEVL